MTKHEAILVELLKQERFGRILGTQCHSEGYCAHLAQELELDGDLDTDFWPREGVHGRCHPDRCPLFYRHDRCLRTMPLYIEGHGKGWAEGERGRKRDIALVTLMLHSGLRVSEVSNLKVSDVRISPRKGSVRVRGGKGEKFRRVPLNVDARKAVQEYLQERGRVEGNGWLFMGQRGEPLKPSGIRYLVERYAYDARLEEVTPHTLRHTFGKNLVDAGVPLDRVAALLGHESVDTTRIYTTPSEQDLQREVEKVALT